MPSALLLEQEPSLPLPPAGSDEAPPAPDRLPPHPEAEGPAGLLPVLEDEPPRPRRLPLLTGAPHLPEFPAAERSWAPRDVSEEVERPGPGSRAGADEAGERGARGRRVRAAAPRDGEGVLASLRGGRLDPDRRGALALALVAGVACVVAGVLVLWSRPQEVVAPPAVERAGSVLGLPPSGPAAGGARGSGAPTGPGTDGGGALPGSGAPSAAVEVVVAVAGEVRRPGLVRLPLGSRVDDAVRAAGGLRPGASAGLLNLARRVVDGEQVLVGVEPPPGSPASGAAGGDGAPGGPSGLPGSGPPTGGVREPVDLNTATVAELDALPGIGPVLAERILAWRTQHGPFRSVDQLREVPGIGEAKFATLRSEVRV